MNYDSLYKVVVETDENDGNKTITKLSYDELLEMVKCDAYSIISKDIISDIEGHGICCLVTTKEAAFVVDIDFPFHDEWCDQKNFEGIRQIIVSDIKTYLRDNKINVLIK